MMLPWKGIAAGLLLLATTAEPAKADAPDNWEGLIKVPSTRLDLVYLQPGADFRVYSKVMLDPTEVAFRKNWLREQRDMMRSRSVDEEDARNILNAAASQLREQFSDAFVKAGYQVVTTPGADVLRISTAILNLDVVAPDTMAAGRSRVYSREAGEATLVIEVRDSLSGSILGRVVDRRGVGLTGPLRRDRMTNITEFDRVFRRWAEMSTKGLAELKALSPVGETGQPLGR